MRPAGGLTSEQSQCCCSIPPMEASAGTCCRNCITWSITSPGQLTQVGRGRPGMVEALSEKVLKWKGPGVGMALIGRDLQWDGT